MTGWEKTSRVAALSLFSMTVSVCALAQDTEEIEEIEEVEIVEVVQAVETVETVEVASSGNAQPGLSLVTIYGRLHQAFVHLPLGFLVLLVLLEGLALIRSGSTDEKSRIICLIATACVTVPAILSGMARTFEMFGDRESPHLLKEHRLAMFVMGGLLLAALATRLFKRKNFGGIQKYAYLALLLGAFIAAAIGGHYGGKLAFGPNHLPF